MTSLEHEALVYGSDDEYAAALVPLLDQALRDGDATIAVVPQRNADVLRAGLGGRSAGVEFIDADEWYRHPVRTTARYDAVLGDLAPGVRACVVGEVRFGRGPREWATWTRYESALNRALQHRPARVVCPYDTRVLPPAVVTAASRTHPFLRAGTRRRRSASYVDPERLLPELPPDVEVPGHEPDVELRVAGSLREARRAILAAAREAGFPTERAAELVVAVNEVLTNAVRHGGGVARLRLWCAAAARELVCVVDDDGPGHDDPLLGLRPPGRGAEGGYGVWLARQLFDRSELAHAPGGGLRVLLAAAA